MQEISYRKLIELFEECRGIYLLYPDIMSKQRKHNLLRLFAFYGCHQQSFVCPPQETVI